MAEFFEPETPKGGGGLFGASNEGPVFYDPDAPKESSSPLRRLIVDPLVGLAKGALVGIPETAVGIADIPTLGYAGKAVESVAKGLGIPSFKEANEAFTSLLSPETQEAQKRVAEAKGFFPTIGTALQNPSAIGQIVAESIPSMLAGTRVVGKGMELIGKGVRTEGILPEVALKRATIAGGLGEGLVTAGQNVEQVRQEIPEGTLTPFQAGILTASGALTGLIGVMSGKLAARLGLEDIQTLMAGGKAGIVGDKEKNIFKKVLFGAIQEGALEELPQSMQEQVAQNLALGKPIGEQVLEQGALGMLAGMAQSSGAQVAGHLLGKIKNQNDPINKEIDKQMQELPEENAAVNPVGGYDITEAGWGFGMGGGEQAPPPVDLSGAGTGDGGFGLGEPAAPVTPVTPIQEPVPPSIPPGQEPPGTLPPPTPPPGGPPSIPGGLNPVTPEEPVAPPVEPVEPPPTPSTPEPTKPTEPIKEPVKPEEPTPPPPTPPPTPPEPPQGKTPTPQPSKKVVPPVPPSPTPGKRSWYEITELPMDQLSDDEMERLADGEGPTKEETDLYNQWKIDREAAASAASGKELTGEEKAAEIMTRVKQKWSENNPHIPIQQVAGHLDTIISETGGTLKASEFTRRFAERTGTQNTYEFIGKLLDRLNVPIILQHRGTSDPTGQVMTDGAYIYTSDMSVPGRIVIDTKAMARSVDYGPGYGVAHVMETFVHEGLHAIVRHSPNWEKSRERLRELTDSILQHQDSAPDSVKRYVRHIDRYDVDELISEAFSDAKFAQWLDSIPAEGVRNPSKTLWGKLKDIIFRAIETFGLGKSKLDQLNEILDDAINVPMEEGEQGGQQGGQDQQGEFTTPKGWTYEEEQGNETYVSNDGQFAIYFNGTEYILASGKGILEKRLLARGTREEMFAEAARLGVDENAPPKGNAPAEPEIPTHERLGPLNKIDTVQLSNVFEERLYAWEVNKDKMSKATITGIIMNEYGLTSTQLKEFEDRGYYDHKAVEEAFEYALVKWARDKIDSEAYTPEGILKLFDDMYNSQPNLASRTSDSMNMQQYSTPLPLAWLMNKYLGMTGKYSNVSVYEPTAGNGMLLIGANPRLASANELDTGNRLKNLNDFLENVTNFDASTYTTPTPGMKDRVIMNPPFGSAPSVDFNGYHLTKLEHQIAARALEAMKDNGKAALIIGGSSTGLFGTGQLTMPDKVFYNFLYNNYNVTHLIEVPGELYARQGTKFPIRLITIDGRKANPSTGIPEYTNVTGPLYSFQDIAAELERSPNGNQAAGEGGEGGVPGGKSDIQPPEVPGGRGPDDGDKSVPGGKRTEPGSGGGRGKGGTGENTPGGRDTGGKGGPTSDNMEPGNIPGGNPTDTGGMAGNSQEGGGAGEPVSAADHAIDNLGQIEVPTFMPYEKAAEEDFYQDKMKPAAEQIATAIIDEIGTEAKPQDFLTRLKDRLKEKWDSYKKYMMRWAREEFNAFVQMVRESALFQIPYKAMSKGSTGNNLVPRNQAQPIQKALEKIAEEHGDIDEWIRNELKYPSLAALHKAFSAEQVDALALALQSIKDNSGMILGDQTGVGKGRVVAGIIRYANSLGKIPIFVTDKANLFSDMYRDLKAIDHKVRPFIMNLKNADIRDQDTGETLINAFADGKGKEAIVQKVNKDGSKTWEVDWSKITDDPLGYFERHDMKVIFSTYSQHNLAGFKNQDTIVDKMGPNNIFILDESHNAAGDSAGGNSNTKLKFTHFLGHAEAVMYSSATFAKTPHNMAIYFRTALGDTGMRMFELVDAIMKGGNPLQEYISSALANAGQYIRRELSFKGINFTQNATMENTAKDSPEYPALVKQYERDKFVADKSNIVVRKIIELSDDLHHPGNASRLAALLASRGIMLGGSGANRMSVTSTTFSSVVHNFNSQLLMAIKVNRTLDEAKKALKEGRKVVINLMNTMGSFLDSMVEAKDAAVGDPIDFNFKEVIQRALKNTLRLSVKSAGGGNSSHVFITLEELQKFLPGVYQKYIRAQDSIDIYSSQVTDLHSSPIDFILSEMRKASGKPVMEITGRDYKIDYESKKGKPILEKRTSTDMDRQRAIRMFNNGESDVIVINRAGSVGISLHASETFKDKSPRRMLFLQPDLDINIFMQALGRINRKGQVALPDYVHITSDLPMEVRPAVILRRKMASLHANTTSKQEGSETRKEFPDMMNKYGNKITRDYLERNKQVAIQAGIIHNRADKIPSDVEYAKVAGKMAVLPVELQKDFFNDIESDYESYISELTAKGENDLISKNYDYQAKTKDKHVIYTGVTPDDPFAGSTYVEQVSVRQLRKPHTMAKLRELVGNVLQGKTADQFNKDIMNTVEAKFDEFWREWNSKLEERYPGNTERQDRAREEKSSQLRAEKDVYDEVLKYFKIGQYYEIPLGENSQENIKGVLTNIMWSPGSGNPVQMSKLKLVFSLSDPLQTAVYNASQSWFREEAFRLDSKIPENWDALLPATRMEEKVIVTGNMLRAFNILSSIDPKVHFEMVNFSRDNGNKEFGLVIARQDEDRLIGFTEGSMMRNVDWHEAHTYLSDPMVETERIATSSDGVITIESVILERKDKKDPTSTARLEFAVSIRGRQDKGGKYYQDRGLLAYVRNNNFRKSGAQMIGNVSLDNLEGFMKELANKFGLRFSLPLDSMAPMPYESTEKGAEQVAVFMPFVSALTDKFMSNPFKEVPPIYIKDVLDPVLKSQNDFQFKDKYLGLPWWNAKKYPAWRRAFEIFGIHRPENRGRLMHNFAQMAEPYFKLEENMKKAGRTSAEIAASKDRINRVITTGDALLGPQLRSLRMQVRTMPNGPERDRLMERIAQIERDNRYSDEQLLAGIKDDQGNKIQLNPEEIRVYSSVRKSLDTMFNSYVDHLQAMAFRNWEKQKWYAILCQAAGMDLSKDSTMRLVGSGLNRAAILRAVKIQPDIRKIFERVEAKIAQTPEIEKKKAGEAYGMLADKIADQIRGMENALSEITGEKDPAKLTQMTKEIFSAYLFTRPHLKKVKALRNLYKKQVAFFPRVREQGEWKMRVVRQTKDNTGNVVAEEQLFMKMFDSRGDAAKIYKEIMDRYAAKGQLPSDIVIQPPEKAVKTPEFAFQGVNDINMQKVLDDAIEGLKIRETYFDENGNKVNLHDHLRNLGYLALAKQFQSRGFGRHMIHRQKGVVKGYEEIDLQRTLFNYMTGMSGIMTKQIAAADFLEHMKTVSESNDNKMFTALAKYGKDQLRNETAADRFSNKVRSFMFTWYLGGVIRPALVQFTQNFVTGIPKHAQWLRENNLGGAGRADKDYSIAMKDVAIKNYTPLEALMQAQLFTDGVTVDQYIREIFGSLGSKWQQGWNKGLQMLAVPFSKMEIFNRQSAALTRFRPAYELALKKVGKDKFTEEDAYVEAFSSARDFVYDTHYAMGKANLPQVAQGEGVGTAIKTLYTFKSFTHNFALATLQDNDWKATLHSMAYIALFGGLMALPFWKDFFEYIEKHYGYSPVNSLRKTLRGLGGRTLETFGMGGLPALLGANISGSLAIGVPFVGEDMLSTVGGVYEGQATKVMRAAEAAGRKDWYRVASNLAPEVMRGPIVAAQESKVGKETFGTPGYATTTKGRPVFNKEGKPLSLGPGEAAVKAAGFQPTEFAREREMDQTIKRQEAWAADAKASAAETYRVARINKDPDALKNMMKAVKEINQGIKDRGIQSIVPLTSVAKIVQSSRQIKGKGELREESYKRAEL